MRTGFLYKHLNQAAIWREITSFSLGLISLALSLYLSFESLFSTLATQASFSLSDDIISHLQVMLVFTVGIAALSPWVAYRLAKSQYYLLTQGIGVVVLGSAFTASNLLRPLYASPDHLTASLILCAVFSLFMVMSGYMILFRLIAIGKLKARFLRGPEPYLFGPHQRFG